MAVDPRAGEKGSSQVIMRRRDGTTQIIDRRTGTVVRETNPQGVQVIRLQRVSGGRGRGSGPSTFRAITDPVTIETQKRNVQEEKKAPTPTPSQDTSSDINMSFVQQPGLMSPDTGFVVQSRDFVGPRQDTGSSSGLSPSPVFSPVPLEEPSRSTPFSFRREQRTRGKERVDGLRSLGRQQFQDARSDFSEGRPLSGFINVARAGATGIATGAGDLISLADDVGSGIVSLATDSSSRSVFASAPALILSSSFRREAGRSIAQSVSEEALGNPIGFTAEIFSGPGLGRGAREVARVSRNVNVMVGTRQIPATQVFDADALAGRTRFPMASSTDEIERLFRGRNLEFVTASPAPIAGRESILAGRGLAGTEGAGLSVTPMGRGSPAFLQTQSDYGRVVFSLNPFRTVSPTATVGRAEGIIRTPSRVTRQPGFEAENIFMRDEVAGTGSLVIPKRIQIGQGDISPQTFRPLVRDTPSDTGTLGRTRLERGTRELEAKVPLGQQFERVPGSGFFGRLKGFDEFTMVDGFAVPLRRIRLTTGAGAGTTGTVISPIDYANIFSGYSSSLRPGTRVVSPFSASGFASIGSSTSVSTPSTPTTSSFIPLGVTNILSSRSDVDQESIFSQDSFSRSMSDMDIASGSRSATRSSTDSDTITISSPASDTDSIVTSPVSSSPSGRSRTPPRSTGDDRGGLILSSQRERRDVDFSFGKEQKKNKYTFIIGREGNKNTSKFTDNNLSRGVSRAKDVVDNSLAASFKVKKNGKTISSEKKSKILSLLGASYRKSKAEKGRFVERRGQRLSSQRERRDIKRRKRKTSDKGVFQDLMSGISRGDSLRSLRRRFL